LPRRLSETVLIFMTDPASEKELISRIIEHLEVTYGVPRLRSGLDPLDTLIETVLSQSTNDRNRDRAFENLKKQFASWKQVRRAQARSIAQAIKVGGLANIKSVRIKKILNEIKNRVGSLDLSFLKRASISEAKQFLTSLDGVGPKTAACVLLFACRHPVFPADTHILRVTRRLGLIPRKCSDERAHEILGSLVPAKKCYSTHINLIRLGRQVCRPTDPKCEQCCLLDYCEYAREIGKI
jgi:endonuclease-3